MIFINLHMRNDYFINIGKTDKIVNIYWKRVFVKANLFKQLYHFNKKKKSKKMILSGISVNSFIKYMNV